MRGAASGRPLVRAHNPGVTLLLAMLALAAPPHLTAASSSSALVVRGTGFAASERVTIRVIGREVFSRSTTTSAGGAFRVRLARPRPLACGRLVVRATGARKDSATLRIGPPECNPPSPGPPARIGSGFGQP
jgi:hypothetical protein